MRKQKKKDEVRFVPKSRQLVTKSGTHPKILAYSDGVKKKSKTSAYLSPIQAFYQKLFCSSKY